MKKRLLFTVWIIVLCSQIFGAQIFLKNGENIHGTITNIEDDILTVESDLGYGVVRISKKDIVSIGFPFEGLNLTRRYAVGYVNRKQFSIGSAQDYNYRTDQFSLKTFLVEDVYLQYLLGYGQIRVSIGGTDQQIASFSSGLRVAKVLFKQMNSHVYVGGGLGIVSVKDTISGFEEQGTDLSLLFGGEIFIGILPNFGISAEIEISKFSTPSIERTDLNVSAFPTFSVHYYF